MLVVFAENSEPQYYPLGRIRGDATIVTLRRFCPRNPNFKILYMYNLNYSLFFIVA